MKNFKRIIKFGKPKVGPIKISKTCYLTVLSAKPQMPSLLDLLNPEGERGAVKGMGVPLAAGATRADLSQSMERGAYALSTPDQLTVIKMYVMPKEEAGFDPAAFVKSEAAKHLDTELLVRIESTWILAQLTFESYDPAAYPALDFLLTIARRLAELTDGVIADPVCQSYRIPSSVMKPRPEGVGVLATEHTDVKVRPLESGLHVYTLGLSKFEHPEIEVYGVSPSAQPAVARFLFGLAQAVMSGGKLEAGVEVGAPAMPLKVAPGGLEEAFWGKASVFELIPSGNEKVEDAIAAWAATVEA